jgi:hypothetical protein
MYDDEVLSEHVAFRLTPAARHKLSAWARKERRSVANLVYTLVCQAIADEEKRREQPFDPPLTESDLP